MAHNNSTPQSVSDAPKLTPEFIKDTHDEPMEFTGVNRAQRRVSYGVNTSSYSRVLPQTLNEVADARKRKEKIEKEIRKQEL